MEDKLKYFFEIGEKERSVVGNWIKTVKPVSRQVRFVTNVSEALKNVKYTYKIATIEPSMNESGTIFYEKGSKVAIGHQPTEWSKKALDYYQNDSWYSKMANLDELFLWYAFRIATNKWTISYVCDDSSSAGNYQNSPLSAHKFEASGARVVGGFPDGVGNTRKIVQAKNMYVICGGDMQYSGKDWPVAYYFPSPIAFNPNIYIGIAVLVVKERV